MSKINEEEVQTEEVTIEQNISGGKDVSDKSNQPPSSNNNETASGIESSGGDKTQKFMERMAELQIQITQSLASQQTLQRNRYARLQPEPLKIKQFSGNVLEYNSFRLMFEKTVNSTEWDKVEKFIHLLCCLDGDAKKSVQSLQLDNESYDTAWATLDRLYNRPRVLAETNILKMMSRELNTIAGHNNSYRNLQFSLQNVASNCAALKLDRDQILAAMAIIHFDAETKSRFENFILHKHAIEGRKNQVAALIDVDEFLLKEINISQASSRKKAQHEQPATVFQQRTMHDNSRQNPRWIFEN